MTPENASDAAVQNRQTDKEVAVTLTVTDEKGDSEVKEETIPSGPTKVPDLKSELGVPAASSLWVVRPSGMPTQLVDHASHNVKAGDKYETVVKGGVS
jgi:hypothetical protein